MTDTIFAMEFLPVDKIPANTLMVDDYIMIDNCIVLVSSVTDNDDTILIEYLDDYDELGEIELNYDQMITTYMLFD